MNQTFWSNSSQSSPYLSPVLNTDTNNKQLSFSLPYGFFVTHLNCCHSPVARCSLERPIEKRQLTRQRKKKKQHNTLEPATAATTQSSRRKELFVWRNKWSDCTERLPAPWWREQIASGVAAKDNYGEEEFNASCHVGGLWGVFSSSSASDSSCGVVLRLAHVVARLHYYTLSVSVTRCGHSSPRFAMTSKCRL